MTKSVTKMEYDRKIFFKIKLNDRKMKLCDLG